MIDRVRAGACHPARRLPESSVNDRDRVLAMYAWLAAGLLAVGLVGQAVYLLFFR